MNRRKPPKKFPTFLSLCLIFLPTKQGVSDKNRREEKKITKLRERSRYPTHFLLQLEEWLALETGPWDAEDHGFQRPQGAKAQKTITGQWTPTRIPRRNPSNLRTPHTQSKTKSKELYNQTTNPLNVEEDTAKSEKP